MMGDAQSKPSEQMTKTILIVDDHPVLRRGLGSLIGSEPDMTVMGEAASRTEAINILRESVPDLVIVDLELDGSDGLELLKEIKIRYPALVAMVLSMHDESLYAERCLHAGAAAFISKQQLDDTILVVIRQLLNGEVFVSAKQKSLFTSGFSPGRHSNLGSPLDVLSDRELQVFRLIGQGERTRDIAGKLSLSHKTIESHREHIKHKLRIESAAQLLRHATHWTENRKFD